MSCTLPAGFERQLAVSAFVGDFLFPMSFVEVIHSFVISSEPHVALGTLVPRPFSVGVTLVVVPSSAHREYPLAFVAWKRPFNVDLRMLPQARSRHVSFAASRAYVMLVMHVHVFVEFEEVVENLAAYHATPRLFVQAEGEYAIWM